MRKSKIDAAFYAVCGLAWLVLLPVAWAAENWPSSLTRQMAAGQTGIVTYNADGSATIMPTSPAGWIAYYNEGVSVPSYAALEQTATTTSGTATFYLTSNKLSGGTARCTTIYASSIRPWVNDSVNYYSFSASVVDNKTVTVSVKRSVAVSNLTVLGVGLPALLGGPTNAPDGTTVNLSVRCAP